MQDSTRLNHEEGIDLGDRGSAATSAAVAAGEVLLEWRERFQVSKKGPRDLVTEADLAAQRLILERLTSEFPRDGFIGEEEGTNLRRDAELCWHVDPLDGTTNYVHGIPFFCVSIGLARGDVPVMGVIHDPVAKTTYFASTGGGALRDGQAIRASGQQRLGEALVAASLPADVGEDSAEAERFVRATIAARAIRRLGSSALNLCYLAEGRFDAFWAADVKSWDVAAGIVIANEAGATLTRPDGSPISLARPQLAAAATAELHAELLGLM